MAFLLLITASNLPPFCALNIALSDCLKHWLPVPIQGDVRNTFREILERVTTPFSFLSRHYYAKQSQIFLHLNLISLHTHSLVLFILHVPLLHTSTGSSSLNFDFHFVLYSTGYIHLPSFHFSSLASYICLGLLHAGYSFTLFST